ncbi:MAG: hypothetical protein GKR92_12770 [Gammaproteobacteria bacterium]|nr:MAG: hypothetical protein GKR92_12770 [Gammaproteobacteria bacterium]
MQKKVNHILLISSSYPTIGEGSAAAGSFVYDFAMELSKHTKVSVLTPGISKNEENTNDVDVFRFKVPKLPLSLLKLYYPTHWLHIVRTLRSGSRALNKLLKRKSVDHILALWVLPSGFWALKAFQNSGMSYSCWALGSDIWSFQNNIFGRLLLNKILSNAKYIYADGYILKKDVTNITNRNCTFLPSTRVLPKIPPKNEEHSGTRFAFLGRWHHNKGIDLLLDALHLLSATD